MYGKDGEREMKSGDNDRVWIGEGGIESVLWESDCGSPPEERHHFGAKEREGSDLSQIKPNFLAGEQMRLEWFAFQSLPHDDMSLSYLAGVSSRVVRDKLIEILVLSYPSCVPYPLPSI
ncbi:unnamed protein product [Onchocerca flexuosa]|nr:unnamed protein product [Onchocerca flexuosa]